MFRDPQLTIARPAWSHPGLFALLAGTLYLTAFWASRQLAGLDRGGEVVARALTVDLALIVPLLYGLVLVRGRGWPAISLVPVFLLSLAGAAAIVPRDHRGWVEGLEWLAAPAELLALGWIGWKARQAVRGVRRERALSDDGDMLEAIRSAARTILPSGRAAEIVASEVAVLYYALASWRRSPAVAAPGVFAYHRGSAYGAVVVALLMAMAAEVVAVHLLVSRFWSPAAAWLLTALGLYGALWLLADYRAARLRPIRLTGEALRIRIGQRWSVELPLEAIVAVRRLSAREPLPKDRRRLGALLVGMPQLLIELDREVVAHGLYGFDRSVDAVALQVDEPERLERELLEAVGPEAGGRRRDGGRGPATG